MCFNDEVRMTRYKLTISYDGSKYFGWQIQVQSPTVQETIETALSHIVKDKITVIAAGRTDSGVHALGQVAHFDSSLNITPKNLQIALNSKLPLSIRINDLHEVHHDFHSRYDATDRTYKYILTSNQTPFNYLYKTYLPKYRINFEALKTCLPYFMGEHDFTSFAKPNPEITNHICHVKNITVELVNEDIVIMITANRFLHNMVRRIVGAMISVSHKQNDPSIITQWIESKKHSQKNYITAPPNGLYLVKIDYPKINFLNI